MHLDLPCSFCRYEGGKIALLVGTITNDDENPPVKARFTEMARAAGGECWTFDQLALRTRFF